MRIHQHGKSGKNSVDIDIEFKEMVKKMHLAQQYLDNRVVTDSTPFIPVRSGVLRESGINSLQSGEPGQVSWNTPYAHYMYEGRTMVGVESRSAYARKYEPKMYDGGEMEYAEPNAKSHWFEEAKKRFLRSWSKGVRKILNGD